MDTAADRCGDSGPPHTVGATFGSTTTSSLPYSPFPPACVSARIHAPPSRTLNPSDNIAGLVFASELAEPLLGSAVATSGTRLPLVLLGSGAALGGASTYWLTRPAPATAPGLVLTPQGVLDAPEVYPPGVAPARLPGSATAPAPAPPAAAAAAPLSPPRPELDQRPLWNHPGLLGLPSTSTPAGPTRGSKGSAVAQPPSTPTSAAQNTKTQARDPARPVGAGEAARPPHPTSAGKSGILVAPDKRKRRHFDLGRILL